MEQEEAHQEAGHQEEALQEEALQGEALQGEVPPAEEHQEEDPLEVDPQEEGNHLHNKPKWHNQYLSKLDHAMNQYAEQKLKNSEETAPTPRNS